MSETTAPKTQAITVQPDDYEKIVGYLLEQPAKIAIPLLNYFQQEQAKAQQMEAVRQKAEMASAEDPKPAPKKK